MLNLNNNNLSFIEKGSQTNDVAMVLLYIFLSELCEYYE